MTNRAARAAKAKRMAYALTRIVAAARAGRIPQKGSYTAPALMTIAGVDKDSYLVGAVKKELEKAGLRCDLNNRFRAAAIHAMAAEIEAYAKELTRTERRPGRSG